MVQYINIDKANNLVYDKPEKVYEKGELLQKFEEFVSVNGFVIKERVNTKRVPYEFVLEKNNKRYRIVTYLKNITGAGWADKPHIRRVQVTNIRKDNIDNYIDTTDTEVLVILGYYNFDNNPIMVAWNAYRYISHNTNRSCYVEVKDLQDGYKKGFEQTTCSDQKIWVFRPEYFETFLDNYIDNNRAE